MPIDPLEVLALRPLAGTHARKPVGEGILGAAETGGTHLVSRYLANQASELEVQDPCGLAALWMSTGQISIARDFLKTLPQETAPEWSLLLGEALFWSGEFAEARRTFETCANGGSPPLLNLAGQLGAGFCHLMEGEIHRALSVEKTIAAREEIFQSRVLSASASAYRGACYAHRGRIGEALLHINRALELGHQPGQRPELWTEALYWRGYIEFLQKSREPALSWARLLALPTPTRPWRKFVAYRDLPRRFFLSLDGFAKNPGAVHFRSLADERVQTGTDGVSYGLGLDLCDTLASHLIIAGPFGLSVSKLCSVLWPDEPLRLRLLQRRLEQIVHRLRNRGAVIEWMNSHVRLLATASSWTTEWENSEGVIRGKSFLEKHDRFRRKDVERFYGISSGSAKGLCREWRESGVISMSISSTLGASYWVT